VGIPGIPRGRLGNSSWLIAALDSRPELVSAGRLAGRLISRAIALAAARGQESPLRRVLLNHLGPPAATWPVLTASWPAFDQVNVQLGVEAWLAGPGRAHQLVGVTGARYWQADLADLLSDGPPDPLLGSPGVGSVTTESRPAGPGGVTHPCVSCGVYLIEDRGQRFALLLRGPEDGNPDEPVRLQVAGASQARAGQLLDEVRRLAAEHNVYRGQVVSFDAEDCAAAGSRPAFLTRPRIGRAEVVLPRDLLDGIERQVVGIARHASALRASGQHLKRGVLLHGPPGTGKTHTVRYLLGQLPGVTAVVLSGGSLAAIGEACSIARALQPSVVVVEDVDQLAGPGEPVRGHWLLARLLNEMDGLGAEANVTFLLTASQADVLEDALAGRPGRIDHTARLPLPDAAARRRLVRLYQGGLHIGRASAMTVVARTDGVTASFIRELLRRAALHAAMHADATRSVGTPPGGGTAPAVNGVAPDAQPSANGVATEPGVALRVTARQLNRALDELLDSSHDLTRVLLGSRPAHGADAVIRPVLPHLRPAPAPTQLPPTSTPRR
jgi:ATPase family associated with various cellular activities (AAA)